MADGDLATVSGQNIEPVNADNGNTDHGHDREDPIAEE
jgi:hypothetical protein